MLSCSPERHSASTSFTVNADEKATFHIHLTLLIGFLRITLHQLNGEILVVQFMHNTLTMHEVVDEKQSFNQFNAGGSTQQVDQNSLIGTG